MGSRKKAKKMTQKIVELNVALLAYGEGIATDPSGNNVPQHTKDMKRPIELFCVKESRGAIIITTGPPPVS